MLLVLNSSTPCTHLHQPNTPRWHLPAVQKDRRLTGLHKDIEELLFDPDYSGAVGECAPP